MSRYLIGQPVSLAVIVTQNDPVTGLPALDGSGNPIRIDDASMACTIYRPDGTTITPAVTHGTTGVYTAQVTPDQTQWWEYVFKGTTTAPGKARGRFYVSPVP